MLTLKNGCVYTLSGHMLWADDWAPSQVIVGHWLTDEQLGPAIGCTISNGEIRSMGNLVGTLVRSQSGIIIDMIPRSP